MIYGARARLNWPRGPYQNPRIAAAGARIPDPAAQLAGHCRRIPGHGSRRAGRPAGTMLRSTRATDRAPVGLDQARPPGAGGYYAGFPDRWGRQKETRPAVSLGGFRGAAARAFYCIKE